MPAIFQMTMDNILVTGKDDTGHLTNLQVSLKDYKGILFSLRKANALSLKYLGYKIDAKGLHTTP